MRLRRKAACIVLTMLAVALVTSQTTLHSQSQDRAPQRRQKKRVAVLRGEGQPPTPPSAEEVAGSNKVKHGMEERVRAFRTAQELLRAKGVPFEPSILLEPKWRQKLRPFLAEMPEMQNELSGSGVLKGAHLANVVRLPEKVQLTGDTVIIANRIVFEGTDVLVKGNHAVHFFALDSMETTGGAGKLTIDTSGRGRKEWLEEQQNKAAQPSAGSRDALRPLTERGGFFISKAGYSHALTVTQTIYEDRDGQPGADGEMGLFGQPEENGSDGQNGVDGSCGGDPNGHPGFEGDWGEDGEDGGRGVDGQPGGDAQPATLTITDPNTRTLYVVTARGGTGGNGGGGGYGGQGGNGGRGGNGGNGAACPGCVLGRGGNAGMGGRGGNGGNGGDGGNGGNGGAGSTIVIKYPSGYDRTKVNADASGGGGGTAGGSGVSARRGSAGSNGQPGKGGSALGCGSSNDGSAGATVIGAKGGASGDPGKYGLIGAPGSVTYEQENTGGGGGGGGGYMESPCTPYYWVYYESWDGGQTWDEVDSVYAGCW
ncbi:MAG TPA: hypothetical protein VGV59_03510 [Pyrinomonadaceae bacterium]|nr:hypothetical protein [Pyrinomonadaceae bacterium]